MPLVTMTSDLSRKDNPTEKQKILGRPSVTAIARDTERVTKFLISPKGLLFNIKQFAQQLMNPNTEGVSGRASIGLTKIYDPISPITNTIGAPLGLRTDRHWPPLVRSPLSTYEGIHKARAAAIWETGQSNRLINLTNELILGKSTPVNNLVSGFQELSTKIAGFRGQPINTLTGLTGPQSLGGIGITTIRRHEDTTKANLINQAEINDQVKQSIEDQGLTGWDAIGALGNAPKAPGVATTLGKYRAISYGQMPVRNHSTTIIDFRKIRNGKTLDESQYLKEENRKSNFGNTIKLIETIDESVDESIIDFQFNDIKFKAYLGMLSDNFAPSWDSSPDQGRADPRYQYTGFERTLSFDFMVAIENAKEATIIWKKLQDLARLTHPVYGSQGFFGQTANVTIGKLFNEKPMIIQDLGYDWDNETPWEIDEDYQHPLYTNVNMTCIVLGDRPESTNILYDIEGLV